MADKLDIEILEEFINANADLEQLEDIASRFNIFTAFKVVDNEIKHSTFLSWLMDPNESHGLGDYFLSIFLKKSVSKASSFGLKSPSVFDIDSWHFDSVEILTEWRNIDILIRDDEHKFVCVIENKIYSKEQGNQLRKYKDIIQSEYPDYSKLFIYLTIEGDKPSDDNYLPLSYSDILQLIEHLIQGSSNKVGSEVLTFISHYKEMLRRYIMQDSEIQEICKRVYKRHKKALDLIFEYKPDKQREIYECLLDIINKDTDLILDDSYKRCIRFMAKIFDFIPKEGVGLTSKRILSFAIYNITNVDMGLYIEICPGPQEFRAELYEIAKSNSKLFNIINRRKLSPQWFAIYKKPMLSAKECEEKEIDEIRELLEGRLRKFKETDLPEIIKNFEKFNYNKEDN